MNMNDIFKELFKPIRAKEELKNQTIAFLAQRTQGYTTTTVKPHKYPLYATVCIRSVYKELHADRETGC